MKRLFIANRGEIAVRVIRTATRLGVETVLGVSEADRDTMGARLADRTICIGAARASDSYLNMNAIVAAALGTHCDAVHPGYGFLSERPEFQQLCEENKIKFVGPAGAAIRGMGDKLEARRLARSQGIPVLSGSDRVHSREQAAELGRQVGYPFLLKAKAGGGGRGMRLVRSDDEVRNAFDNSSAEAIAAFGDGDLYIERYIENARHIEVQILGDGRGTVLHVGDRDCTVQRRHQKLIEEAPATVVDAETRNEMVRAAVRLGKEIGYESAGTVEFIYDVDSKGFYFLEMNARIQVEHPVTEMISGIDLVAEQLRIADDSGFSLTQDNVELSGHAVECRINAELVDHDFTPNPGVITAWEPPNGAGIRVDSHCHEGYRVPPFYDSMLGKLIVYGTNREAAIDRMKQALKKFRIDGVATTLNLHRKVLSHDEFRSNQLTTNWLQRVFLGST